jgi:exodeoxyribonuclease VIII
MSAATMQVVRDMPDAEYHALTRCSASALKALERSTPRHWHAQQDRDSAALVQGRLLHCMVLTPGVLRETFACAPQVDRRTKEGKAAYAAFEAESAGRQVVPADVWTECERMAYEVCSHPAAARLLEGTERELSLIGTLMGVDAKARVDAYHPVGACIDIKTTRGLASREEFERAIVSWGYGIQAAWYRMALRAAGLACEHVAFVVVEKAEPYAVAVFRLADDVIDWFDAELPRLVDAWQDAQQHPDRGWPATVQDIGVPAWFARRMEAQEVGHE